MAEFNKQNDINLLKDPSSSALTWIARLMVLMRRCLHSSTNPFGSAATADTGFNAGQVPTLESDGKYPVSVVDPSILSPNIIGVTSTPRYTGTGNVISDITVSAPQNINGILHYDIELQRGQVNISQRPPLPDSPQIVGFTRNPQTIRLASINYGPVRTYRFYYSTNSNITTSTTHINVNPITPDQELIITPAINITSRSVWYFAIQLINSAGSGPIGLQSYVNASRRPVNLGNDYLGGRADFVDRDRLDRAIRDTENTLGITRDNTTRNELGSLLNDLNSLNDDNEYQDYIDDLNRSGGSGRDGGLGTGTPGDGIAPDGLGGGPFGPR